MFLMFYNFCDFLPLIINYFNAYTYPNGWLLIKYKKCKNTKIVWYKPQINKNYSHIMYFITVYNSSKLIETSKAAYHQPGFWCREASIVADAYIAPIARPASVRFIGESFL